MLQFTDQCNEFRFLDLHLLPDRFCLFIVVGNVNDKNSQSIIRTEKRKTSGWQNKTPDWLVRKLKGQTSNTAKLVKKKIMSYLPSYKHLLYFYINKIHSHFLIEMFWIM
jgi:hypothetical protein